jgi:tellurite resistance protein
MLQIDKLKELYSSTVKTLKHYTPEAFSKEKKFINAIVISLALMTMADKVVETDEVIESMGLIDKIDQIKDLDMKSEAIELYKFHIKALEEAVNDQINWITTIAKLLSDIGKIKPYPEYHPLIENLLDHIAESDGNYDPLEKEMKEKIIKAMK